MALISCWSCGEQVSTLAKGCPHCGAAHRSASMPSPEPPSPKDARAKRRHGKPGEVSVEALRGWLTLQVEEDTWLVRDSSGKRHLPMTLSEAERRFPGQAISIQHPSWAGPRPVWVDASEVPATPVGDQPAGPHHPAAPSDEGLTGSGQGASGPFNPVAPLRPKPKPNVGRSHRPPDPPSATDGSRARVPASDKSPPRASTTERLPLGIGRKDKSGRQVRIEHRGEHVRVSRTGGEAIRKQVKVGRVNLTANSKHGIRASTRLANKTDVALQNGNFRLRGRYGKGDTKVNLSKSGLSVSQKTGIGTLNITNPNRSSVKIAGYQVRGEAAAELQAAYLLAIIGLLVGIVWVLVTYWYIILGLTIVALGIWFANKKYSDSGQGKE